MFDMVEKHSIINLSSCSSKYHTVVVIGYSEVDFQREEEDAAFILFTQCMESNSLEKSTNDFCYVFMRGNKQELPDQSIQ